MPPSGPQLHFTSGGRHRHLPIGIAWGIDILVYKPSPSLLQTGREWDVYRKPWQRGVGWCLDVDVDGPSDPLPNCRSSHICDMFLCMGGWTSEIAWAFSREWSSWFSPVRGDPSGAHLL
ncbi:hypothetical protein TNCV_335681 [Trichonephila clavipes]|nr:hypothetical protein TNCV_335681 [Trichonephila clavipes]